MRVGQGFDAHPLVKGRALVLGGVYISFPKGLSGHSDGDVLAHAIIDALLGAACLGDKGVLFPSCDSQYRNISSMLLLSEVSALLDKNAWRVLNLDVTIVAQEPRLGPFVRQMIKNLSITLNLVEEVVSIKATTTDCMGFTGRGEGIAALAVTLLENRL